MNTDRTIRALFVTGGLYDAILGVAFVVAAPAIFARLGISPPGHWGYVHFAALLLIVFAAAFFAVARDPAANRNLIPYGLALKLAYAGTVFYHWLGGGGVATVWKVFAFADLVFAGLFVWAYAAIARSSAADPR